MRDELRILLTGSLNVGKSIGEINTAISGIEKKIKKLKLRVEIDDKVTQTLRNFAKEMQRVTDASLHPNKIIEEMINPDGSKMKRTFFNGMNGEFEEITKKAKESGKAQLKSIDEVTEGYEHLNRQTERYNAQQKKIGETLKLSKDPHGIESRTINANNKGEVIGYTDTYNKDKEINLTKKQTEENKKLVQSKEELNRKHKELIQLGQLSSQQSLKLQKMIETSTNPEHIKLATDEHKRLLGISNELLKVQQARVNVNKKTDAEIAKEKELNRVLQQKLDLYKKEQALKVQDLKQRYSGIDDSVLNAHMTRVNNIGLSKDTPHIMRDTSLGLKQIEMDAKRAGSQIGKARGHAISLSEAFSTAMVKFPIDHTCRSKTPLIAGNPLEPFKLQRKNEICLSVKVKN